MRHFHSYGPVDAQEHYCVERRELVEQCVAQLIGNPDKGGHYFTIWAPRQTGKTWLMGRAVDEIRRQHGDRFQLVTLSMQEMSLKETDPPEVFLSRVPRLFEEWTGLVLPQLTSWDDWRGLFVRGHSPFDRPIILLIDEFDKLPPAVLDQLVNQFRGLYLNPRASLLHSLALVGVRAVLGVDSARGSPFNVQRSLHVPNLSSGEVQELFRQYQAESGQVVVPAVVETLHRMTRGQPGLCGWFGELLTEKYNPRPAPITMQTWDEVYAAACQLEPNNTMLNLLKKAMGPHLPQVLEIFSRTDVPFSFGQEWCNFLYTNGIIESQKTVDGNGMPLHVCRFSSPFVQQRLFSDLSVDVLERLQDLPLDPLDTLPDVFTAMGMDVPALLGRYVAFLGRLRQKGQDPWKDQPRRKDLQHREAVGHFHLYNWLCAAVGKRCVISPEFPTGNGTVDLVLRWQGHTGVIEVKSFVDQYQLGLGQKQAADYAARLGLKAATVAVFVPVTDEAVLRALSSQKQLGEIQVTTVAISWER